MKMLKYYTVYVDGIDKTGKDSIAQYIMRMTNYECIVNSRGILSQIAYDKLYNRNRTYELIQQKYIINVLLDVEEEDWKIRCAYTQEPKINYEANKLVFYDARKTLIDAGYEVLSFNTSHSTPYEIATKIVEFWKNKNKE